MSESANQPSQEFEFQITASPDVFLSALKTAVKNRSLVWVLAKRELKIRYSTGRFRQLWVLAKPALIISLYLFVLLKVLHVKNSVDMYALVVISGLLVWQPFIENIHSGGKSVVADAELVARSNIPRLIFPVYRTLLTLPEIAVIFAIFVVVAACTGKMPPQLIRLTLLPAVFLLNYLLLLGISLWSNIWYFLKPDTNQLLYMLLPFVLWITPVFYLPEMVPELFRYILLLNPLSSVIGIFRYILMGTPLTLVQWLPGTIINLLIFTGGLNYFVKQQDLFAEKL